MCCAPFVSPFSFNWNIQRELWGEKKNIRTTTFTQRHLPCRTIHLCKCTKIYLLKSLSPKLLLKSTSPPYPNASVVDDIMARTRINKRYITDIKRKWNILCACNFCTFQEYDEIQDIGDVDNVKSFFVCTGSQDVCAHLPRLHKWSQFVRSSMVQHRRQDNTDSKRLECWVNFCLWLKQCVYCTCVRANSGSNCLHSAGSFITRDFITLSFIRSTLQTPIFRTEELSHVFEEEDFEREIRSYF